MRMFTEEEVEILMQKVSETGNPRTNADRIRAMSDEQLATVIMCPNDNGLADIECDRSDNCNCYECCLKWLRSEVEEKYE